LNDYARATDPFARIGERSVSVEISSVVRARNDSFHVRWVERSYRYKTALLNVLSALSIAALVLAGVGLFGVCSYSVSQRKPELGIRRALGARRSRVVWMVMQESGAVVALGLLAGLGLAYAGHTLLASFLFGVTSLDWVSHLGVVGSIVLLAVLALLGPAMVAARVSPMRAIAGR